MDNQVLHRLYVKYARELYLYIYSLCKNSEAAEDLLQETFLKAFLSLPDGHTNMRAWLYRVAKNLCFNYMKRDKRCCSMEQIEEMSKEETDVLKELLLEEDKKLLYKSLSRLSPQKREILILQYFGGLSQKEIAVVMQITPENVRVLAFRAKKDLKKYMEELL